jgi:hypothetical protein
MTTSAIKTIPVGVTKKIIRVVSGELVFMALVWGQLAVVVVTTGCTRVIMVLFVSVSIPPLELLLVECVGEGLGMLTSTPVVVALLEVEVGRGIQDIISSSAYEMVLSKNN